MSGRVIKVVGVSFVDGYPGNLLRLRDIAGQADAAGESLPVVLRRNPANPYDANAIEVHVPAVGMVGHVDKAKAAILAPLLDQGVRFATDVFMVAVDPHHPDRPGLDIRVRPLNGAEVVTP